MSIKESISGLNFSDEFVYCGKTLSEIITPSNPKFYPLYKKDYNKIFYPCDQRYANHLFYYIHESETKLSRADTIKRLKSIEHYFNNETAKKIFNRLISDTRCLDRIVFVNDGSHRTHRIWYGFPDLCVEIDEGKYSYDNNYSTSQDSKGALKAFYKILERYEKIFIQV